MLMYLIPTLAALVIGLSNAFELAVPARPSCVHIDKLSKQYPVTLLIKLFSSVPKREYAIQDINLTFGQKKDDGVVLLVGRSASGKSTLLRLIAGMEMPTQGCVSINGHKITQILDGEAKGVGSRMPSWIKVGKISQSTESQPVILDGKPDFDDSLTVMERILKMSSGDNIAQSELLANDFVNLLGLDGQLKSLPSALSPSEQYLFSIACACMVSVSPAIKEHNDNDSDIPYPILLLDELFDTEVPSTVEKCDKGITNLIQCGAVVISATHRPNYFKGMSKRIVTLSGGKVLTDVSTS
ncbi:hypothetical protein ACHAWT_004873 [Skeletonema menzelii]